ncbi:MAG: Holliday junction branch migration protein RuvA [Firmicutes bacterium]|nr:Holliday junction branch migration protein RuvA [Bacillota bacterium]
MFSYLRGVLVGKGSDYVVVENAGIGWQVAVPAPVSSRLALQEEVKLFIYFAVREDTLQLYGFLTQDELSLFKLLLSVTGIGPKVALAILSTLEPAEFILAVMQENTKVLTRVPGVGPKSAKRLLVELKDKVAAAAQTALSQPAVKIAGENNAYSEALEALLALGYSGPEAQAALQASGGGEELTSQDLLRKALAYLGSQ